MAEERSYCSQCNGGEHVFSSAWTRIMSVSMGIIWNCWVYRVNPNWCFLSFCTPEWWIRARTLHHRDEIVLCRSNLLIDFAWVCWCSSTCIFILINYKAINLSRKWHGWVYITAVTKAGRVGDTWAGGGGGELCGCSEWTVRADSDG